MRRLEGPELVAYDLVPRAVLERVRVQQVPVLPPGASGMTVGRFVFLRRDDDRTGTRELLAHELVHAHQYAEQGLVGFLADYLRDYATGLRRHRSHRAAYLSIPAEAEARSHAAAWRTR
ncbi:MAG: DUF4157 domain-containing protein [Acidimicrobiales bacterium]|nr:DUF4157 domain-containing protein [Acidimicrobiales bacterium]